MAQKILIVQTAFIGDLLLSIPLIRRVKSTHPRHRLYLLCRKGLGEFFRLNRLADHIVEVDKSKEVKSDPDGGWQELKGEEFDFIICPHESVTSARIVAALNSPLKIGYKKMWNFFAFNRRVSRPMHLPEALRQLALLAEIDEEMKHRLAEFLEPDSPPAKEITLVKPGRKIPEWASMTLPVLNRADLAERLKSDPQFYGSMDKVFQFAQNTKAFDREVIFLAPGSVWATKRWTLSGYVELGKSLRRRGYHVAIVGAPDEAEICRELTKQVAGAFNFCGQTSLFETFLLFQKGKALVCNDSGAMHLAAVAGLPTVAVFGPTTLELGYRPWQEKAAVVEVDLSCRPCGKHGGEKCPIGTHQCMADVNDLMVADALSRLLQG